MKRITTLLLLIAFTLTVYGQNYWSGIKGGWYHEKQVFTFDVISFVVNDATYIIAYPEAKVEGFYYPDERGVWLLTQKNGEWVKAIDTPLRMDDNNLRTYMSNVPFKEGLKSTKPLFNDTGGIQVTLIVFGKRNNATYFFDHYETYVFHPRGDGMFDFKRTHTPDIKMRPIEND